MKSPLVSVAHPEQTVEAHQRSMRQPLVVKKEAVLLAIGELLLVVLAALVVAVQVLLPAIMLELVVVTVQTVFQYQLWVQVELVKALLPENLEKLQETCIAAVAVELPILCIRQNLPPVAMAVEQKVQSQQPTIPVVAVAAVMDTAALVSLLSASIRRRQHEIRNRN